jgi:hypothetical protein
MGRWGRHRCTPHARAPRSIRKATGVSTGLDQWVTRWRPAHTQMAPARHMRRRMTGMSTRFAVTEALGNCVVAIGKLKRGLLPGMAPHGVMCAERSPRLGQAEPYSANSPLFRRTDICAKRRHEFRLGFGIFFRFSVESCGSRIQAGMIRRCAWKPVRQRGTWIRIAPAFRPEVLRLRLRFAPQRARRGKYVTGRPRRKRHDPRVETVVLARNRAVACMPDEPRFEPGQLRDTAGMRVPGFRICAFRWVRAKIVNTKNCHKPFWRMVARCPEFARFTPKVRQPNRRGAKKSAVT